MLGGRGLDLGSCLEAFWQAPRLLRPLKALPLGGSKVCGRACPGAWEGCQGSKKRTIWRLLRAARGVPHSKAT